MLHKTMLPMLMLSAATTLLHAQAMIEYGASAGRSGGAAGLAAPGRSVSNVFGKVNKTLAGGSQADETAKHDRQTAVTPTTAPTPAAAPSAPAIPLDFSAIVTGMERADLLKKLGKPSMSLTSTESSTLVETCWYRRGEDRVTVILRDGKVSSVSGVDNSTAK